MQNLQNLLAVAFLGNSVLQWLYAIGIMLLTVAVVRVVLAVVLRRIKALADRTETDLDDLVAELLAKTKLLLIFLIGVWGGSRILQRDQLLDDVFGGILVIGLLLQAGFWGMGVIDYAVKRQLKRLEKDDPGLATAMGALSFMARVALWATVGLTALGSLGVEITAFVASLGIGGFAVALALQNVLGDLLASLSIIFDKPFEVGDYIVTGDVKGSVEHVGLKTTRLRALGGEQLIVSNSDLLSSRIQNFKRMEERRASFTIGVTYDTPPSQLRQIPQMIRESIESRENTRFDRSHFARFGPSSLDFETVFHMEVSDYSAFMDTQQAINLELYERFAKEGIEFAYPTQTILLAGGAPPQAPTSQAPAL